ncbi:MAG: AsmA-like C-terminal region-containing protein, partial [Methylococcales bacterium]
RYPSSFWQYAEGESEYSLDLQIPKLAEKLYVDIDLESDLKGIAVELPEPLHKDRTDRRRFSLKTHLEYGQDIPLDLLYGSLVQARLKLAREKETFRLQQGLIQLGSIFKTNPAPSGLSFYADLKSFDLAPWKSFLASSNRPEQRDLALNAVDVRIGQLMLGEDNLGPFSLKMQRREGAWEGLTESNIARGRFSADHKGQTRSGFNLSFEYLKIPERKNSPKQSSTEKLDLDPASIVDLDITAKHFFWKEQDYGKLTLVTRQQPNGMIIDRLNIREAGTDVNLSGSWTRSESSHRTAISGDMTIDDLGDFLSRRGKSKVIQDSNVRSRFLLQWNDPLVDLDDASLSGEAQIDFGAGSLLTVEPGIGRVFGLFNLDGLKNLLLL